MSIQKTEIRFARFMLPISNLFLKLKPIVDIIIRIYIAEIFFRAGLTKLASWFTTVMLFSTTYHVPLLSPEVAAFIGTAAELVLPVLLVLGFGTRIMILVFFIYNAVAAISYPFLWTPDGAAGLQQHITWGLLLATLMVNGPGKLSLDYWLYIRHMRRLRIDETYHAHQKVIDQTYKIAHPDDSPYTKDKKDD